MNDPREQLIQLLEAKMDKYVEDMAQRTLEDPVMMEFVMACAEAPAED